MQMVSVTLGVLDKHWDGDFVKRLTICVHHLLPCLNMLRAVCNQGFVLINCLLLTKLTESQRPWLVSQV